VLVYSNDAILLMTCRLLLEAAGYRVFTTLELSDAIDLAMNRDIALLIFCQNLQAHERPRVLVPVRAAHPETKILMMRLDEPLPPIEAEEAILDVSAEPDVLLGAIHKMLDGSVLSQPSPE
jgi:DNA-binding NarL/FixJ family response regulator